jgi:adenylylsulfate kinase
MTFPDRRSPGKSDSSIQKDHEILIWLTGLSSAGKTTLSRLLAEELRNKGEKVEVLDGDVLRNGLCKDLGFSKTDRDENIRRIGYVAQLLVKTGIVVIVAAVSPYRELRDQIRAMTSGFVEVYVNAPLPVCEQRDVKGLYRKARGGELLHFTGIDDPYEAPLTPEVECRTDKETVFESVNKVLRYLESRFWHVDSNVSGRASRKKSV